MSFFLYGHGGSADHGSEDRVRGLCRLLPEPPDLYSADPEEDWRYGLGEVAGLFRCTAGVLERQVRRGDWCFSMHPKGAEGLRRRGGRMILWGWAVGPESLTRETARELRSFEAVVVTDARSFYALRDAGLDQKAQMGPDPAFLVERHIRPLGGAFRQDTVGLCFGAGMCNFERENGLLFRSYCCLIRYLLERTSFQIALIPYCAKAWRDDCLLLTALKRQFPDNERIFLRKDGDCRVLRGDLSLCRCCVGASGAMAAWSCAVPGLCLGASPRAMGLAQELFGSWQDAVIPVASLKREEDLTERFCQFLAREDRLRRRLERVVPLRRQRAAEWRFPMLKTVG